MITSIRLDQQTLQASGLSEANHFERLGRLVILAGPNGGGKTRLLSAIMKTVARASSAHRSLPQLRAQVRRNEDFARDNPNTATLFQPAAQQLAEAEAAVASVSWTECPTSIALLDAAEIGIGRAMMPDFDGPGEHLLRSVADHRAESLAEHARALFNASHPMLEGPRIVAEGRRGQE